MATIKDIACEAQVSIASVSRYFNNRDLLSEETCKRIEAVVQKHNYSPSSLGRGLRLARSGKILVLLPTMENPMYLRILSAIENECYQYGFTVLTCDTHSDSYKERHLMSMLSNHYADGAISFASTLESAELNALARRFPLVQCCEQEEDVEVSCVCVDNRLASFEAVEHLIQQGHRRIGMASGTAHFISTTMREDGYIAALTKHNLPIHKEYIIRGNYGFSSGAKAAQQLLAMDPAPTALFCISDAVAIGAVRYAMQNKKNIAAIGFDDTSFAKIYMPGITSVAQPRSLMGKTAVELLLGRIENNKLPAKKVILAHELVIRESTQTVILS